MARLLIGEYPRAEAQRTQRRSWRPKLRRRHGRASKVGANPKVLERTLQPQAPLVRRRTRVSRNPAARPAALQMRPPKSLRGRLPSRHLLLHGEPPSWGRGRRVGYAIADASAFACAEQSMTLDDALTNPAEAFERTIPPCQAVSLLASF